MPALPSNNLKCLLSAVIIINSLPAFFFSFNILVLCHFLYLSFSLSEIYLVCATYSIIPSCLSLFVCLSVSLVVTSTLYYLKSISLPCSMAFCLCHSSPLTSFHLSPISKYVVLLSVSVQVYFCIMYHYLFTFNLHTSFPVSAFLLYHTSNSAPFFPFTCCPSSYFSLIYICLQSEDRAADWSRQMS